jgi:hypothetical protein
MRLGSNAILRLPGGVVARDEPWAETARQEVRVAGDFRAAGVPCVRPLPVHQPVTVDGHPVTFWAEVPGPHGDASVAELGTALRVLHGVDAIAGLPPLGPWEHTPGRIERAPLSAAEPGRHEQIRP